MINKKGNKKKLAFLSPAGKGGTYYYYEQLTQDLKATFGENIDIYFFHSVFDYIKLHFSSYDMIISIIPFLFHPLRTRTFIFHIQGDYKVQRKVGTRIAHKVEYLSEWNLYFCNKILLSSYFLADKFGWRKQYENKIRIIPIGIKVRETYQNRSMKDSYTNLLTVTSAQFYQKGKGIIDIAQELTRYNGQNNLHWIIILGGDVRQRDALIKQLSTINLPKNISLEILDWQDKNALETYYKQADIFVYASQLETWGIVIMEAINFGLPVIIYNNNPLWPYIYPQKLRTQDICTQIGEVENNYEEYKKLCYEFLQTYDQDTIIRSYWSKFLGEELSI